MLVEEAIQEYGGQPLPRQVMLSLLQDYSRPYDKISEMERQEKLIRLRRGLYLPGPRLRMERPSAFLTANLLYGPSYVSLESALAHWQLIPERVYETSSVTTELGRVFDTPVGRFSFTRLPLPYYSYGIKSIVVGTNQHALVASPEKALCDKIVSTAGVQLRSMLQSEVFLLEDLRMEKEQLRELNLASIESWINQAPKKASLQQLVKFLRRL